MYVPTRYPSAGSFQTKRVSLMQLVAQTRSLSETPDEAMLKRLRILERKMGLVLTLVRNALLYSYLSSDVISVVQGIRLGCGERAESFGTPTRQ